MGSVTETIKETIDNLMDKGEKVGLVSVHLYRPFSAKYFFKVLPETVKRIAFSTVPKNLAPMANHCTWIFAIFFTERRMLP